MTTMTAPSSPTRFSDDQVVQIVNLAIGRYETLELPQLVEEIIGLDEALISDATAQLISELLQDGGYPSDQPATFVGLRVLLSPNKGETPDDRRGRALLAASTAIALGLHAEENGWMVRLLLEDPDDAPAAEWVALLEEVDRRLMAEVAQ